MDIKAASKLELNGKVEYYIFDSGIHFTFHKISDKKDSGENINLPFEIYSKFKDNEVKISIIKI